MAGALEKGIGYICYVNRCLTLFTLLILMGFNACTRTRPAGSNTTPTHSAPFKPEYKLSELDSSDLFNSGNALNAVEGIDEVSGMATGIKNPGDLWVHNDGGDASLLYLLDGSTAQLKGIYSMAASNTDWEDIAISYDIAGDHSYLWVADIGDNLLSRINCSLYKVEELPVVYEVGDTVVPKDVKEVTEYVFHYPDGYYNAETLMIDPLNGEIIVVTRGDEARVYSALETTAQASGVLDMVYRGTLPIAGITGGDVSRNGNHIVMRTYREILLWNRQPGQSVVEALANTPVLLPYIKEPQGEAICWGANGYYTLSERVGSELPSLYHYPFK
tara:strand:+ start:10964 stop:11956 length:993 start_codon:yes stop_codon:yes gene_type:complete